MPDDNPKPKRPRGIRNAGGRVQLLQAELERLLAAASSVAGPMLDHVHAKYHAELDAPSPLGDHVSKESSLQARTSVGQPLHGFQLEYEAEVYRLYEEYLPKGPSAARQAVEGATRGLSWEQLQTVIADGQGRGLAKYPSTGLTPGREKRRHHKAEILETFEERDERLSALPKRGKANPPQSASEVSKRLDKDPDSAGQIRECPVCRRQFQIGRKDQITCDAHCRDLARRVRSGDPTVEASIKMLFDPPPCLGCEKPLWAMRPDAKYHGATCRKKAERASAQRVA